MSKWQLSNIIMTDDKCQSLKFGSIAYVKVTGVKVSI